MGPLWLLSSMTTKLGTWDGEHKVSRAENIDYLALKTQTVHPPGTERAHSSDAWLAVSTPHAPGPERLREAPGPQEWEPSQCGSTSWKSARGAPRGPQRKLRTLTAALRSARGDQIHLGTPLPRSLHRLPTQSLKSSLLWLPSSLLQPSAPLPHCRAGACVRVTGVTPRRKHAASLLVGWLAGSETLKSWKSCPEESAKPQVMKLPEVCL